MWRRVQRTNRHKAFSTPRGLHNALYQVHSHSLLRPVQGVAQSSRTEDRDGNDGVLGLMACPSTAVQMGLVLFPMTLSRIGGFTIYQALRVFMRHQLRKCWLLMRKEFKRRLLVVHYH